MIHDRATVDLLSAQQQDDLKDKAAYSGGAGAAAAQPADPVPQPANVPVVAAGPVMAASQLDQNFIQNRGQLICRVSFILDNRGNANRYADALVLVDADKSAPDAHYEIIQMINEAKAQDQQESRAGASSADLAAEKRGIMAEQDAAYKRAEESARTFGELQQRIKDAEQIERASCRERV